MTPEERAKADAIRENGKQIRAIGNILNRAGYAFRRGVHTCILARESGWPYNPDRLQRVLEAAWEIHQARERAKDL